MAKSSNGLHLPGNFNSFPKGPKPAHYAPHTQRDIGRPSPQGPPSQRTVEARTAERGPRHNIQSVAAPARSPKHNITEANLRERTPKHSPTLKSADELRVRQNGGGADRVTKSFKDRTDRMTTLGKEDVNISDPHGNYYFELSISPAAAGEGAQDGRTGGGVKISGTVEGLTTVAHFRECTGLKSSSEVFEIAEGGMNGRTYRRPGQGKWDNIVLKFAMTSSSFMVALRDNMVQDKLGFRFNGMIALKNNKGETVRKFSFQNGWAVSWEGPALNANGSDLAIETIEIAHEGLQVETVAPAAS